MGSVRIEKSILRFFELDHILGCNGGGGNCWVRGLREGGGGGGKMYKFKSYFSFSSLLISSHIFSSMEMESFLLSPLVIFSILILILYLFHLLLFLLLLLSSNQTLPW